MNMKKLSLKNKKIVMTVVGIIVAAWTAYQNNSHQPDQSVGLSEKIIYTKHAKCRMNCRLIDKIEINDVLKSGKINRKKSNSKASPCPVFAKEKRTKDKQLARVVYASCPGKIKIITVIDLENKYSCHCN